MTAGRGVMHSEMPHENEMAHTLAAMAEPAGQAQGGGGALRQPDTPTEVPVRREDGVEVRVYAGRSGAAEHPHGSDWPMMLLDLRMEPGKSLVQEIPPRCSADLFMC